MLKGKVIEDKVVIEDNEAQELYSNSWYGDMEKGSLVLSLIEACYLFERGKIEINGMNFKDFFNFCNSKIENFFIKYNVYKDIRDRGLPVKEGFKGSDLRVYERGVKPGKEKAAKWIVFLDTEDFECNFERLEESIKMVKNIKATALWAVLDNDLDCTYYIISEVSP